MSILTLYTLTLRFTNGTSHVIETTDVTYIRDLVDASFGNVTSSGFTVSWTDIPTFLEQRDQEST